MGDTQTPVLNGYIERIPNFSLSTISNVADKRHNAHGLARGIKKSASRIIRIPEDYVENPLRIFLTVQHR